MFLSALNNVLNDFAIVSLNSYHSIFIVICCFVFAVYIIYSEYLTLTCSTHFFQLICL